MRLDLDKCWAAVERRDAAADGNFIYGVVTTGVYCRPGCPLGQIGFWITALLPHDCTRFKRNVKSNRFQTIAGTALGDYFGEQRTKCLGKVV